MTQCGRPAKTGAPCRVSRVGPPLSLSLRAMFGGPVPDVNLPPSCWRHLTPAELARMEALRAEDAAERQRLAEMKPPACWTWPIPADLPEDAGRAMALRLLRNWQAGRCAICGDRIEVLDHDHMTGLVRGWLCRCCNTLEGFAADPADPCMQYRTRNPASILGLCVRYFSPFTGWAELEPEVDERKRLDRHPAHILATRYGVRRDS